MEVKKEQFSHEERFKTNALGLLDFAKDIIFSFENPPISETKFKLLKTAIEVVESKFLIESFIDSTYNFWDSFRQKDVSFFLGNSKQIFGSLFTDNMNLFKILFESDKLTKEDRNDIFDYFIAEIKISIKYINSFNGDKFKFIDLQKESKKFNVKL